MTFKSQFAATPGGMIVREGTFARPRKEMATGSRQLVEQSPRLFQIGRTEAFDEPVVDWGEQVSGFCTAILVAAEPGEAHGGAQFPDRSARGLLPGSNLAKQAIDADVGRVIC